MNKDLKEYIKNKFLYINLKNINNSDPKSSIIVEYKNSDDIYNLINVNDQITVSDINGNLQNIDPLNLSFKNSFFKLNDNINKISNINNNKIQFVDKNNNNNNMSFDEFNKNILSRHRKELIGGGNNVNTIDDIYKNFNDSYVNYQNGSGQDSNYNSRFENFHARIENDVVGLKNAFRSIMPGTSGTELVNYTNDMQKLVKENLITNNYYQQEDIVRTFISEHGQLHKRFKEFEKLKLEKKGMLGRPKPDNVGIQKGKEVLNEWINFFTIYLVTLNMISFRSEILIPLIKKNYDYIKHWGGNKMHTIIKYLHHKLCNHHVYFNLGTSFINECKREWEKECEHVIMDTTKPYENKLQHLQNDKSCLRACEKTNSYFGETRPYCKEFNAHYKNNIPVKIIEENKINEDELQKVGLHLNEKAEQSANTLNNPHGIVVDPNIANKIPVVNVVPLPPPYPGPP